MGPDEGTIIGAMIDHFVELVRGLLELILGFTSVNIPF